MRSMWSAVGALAVALLACGVWLEFDHADAPSASQPVNLAEARQQELLKQNVGKPGDLNLGNTYREINARHFANAIPEIPVIWESRLAEVGPLAAQQFTLEGMFGHVGKQALILLNPDLMQDRPRLLSSLCHEMVHAYLFMIGDNSTNHGPAFQDVLRRLSTEGAFDGIFASDEEKAGLRAWLDAESVRIDRERSEMDQLGGDIERERADADRELADLNARITAANAAGRGWPAQSDVDAVTARRDRYNQHAIEANARIEKDRADLAEFNLRVARYNLMVSYPDGLDEEAVVKPKSPLSGRGE